MDSWICVECSKKFDIVPIFDTEEYEIKGKKILIDAEKAICPCCGRALVNNAADDRNLEKAYRKYREEEHLLMPEEIKKIRQKYGITQVGFSRILGFGDKTIARYENGALQDAAPNNLILLMKNENNFIGLWKERKSLLDPKERKNVEDFIFAKYPTVKIDWHTVLGYCSSTMTPYRIKGVNLT